MYPLIRSLLFTLPPEFSHHFSLYALNKLQELHLTRWLFGNTPQLPRTVMGLNFPNPLGLAAGFDKNAKYIDGLGALGVGFIEVGTVTPQAQSGNPPPRLFRLPQAQAIINRLGFNNQGVVRVLRNLQQAKNFQGILGINIGKNADTPLELAISDYLAAFFSVYPFADYVTINLSSPNTEKLRNLQHGPELNNLLNALKQAQEQLANKYNKYVPLVVKIAPDLTSQEVSELAQQLLNHRLEGVIATNTTTSREPVKHLRYSREAGGLSGAPLFSASTEVIKQLNAVLQGRIPIIASGGIMSAANAQAKIQAGAQLLQIYTGLIYRGPTLIKEIMEVLRNSSS